VTAAVLWTCAAITVGVFGVMLYSVATFEHKVEGSTSRKAHNVTIEVLWFSIPILIFVSALVPAVGPLLSRG
jgi:heme/copper-type cytochrome/quinol oxidase subunit 2